MSSPILLLHRAIRNAGDALILHRARSLVAERWRGTQLETGEAWRPLRDQFSSRDLARFRCVVICGGPGYAKGLAARYPLGDLSTLPPVVPMALGSFVVPGTERQLADHAFDAADRAFLDAILDRAPFLGSRDPLTTDLLLRAGYDRVLTTGDPVWYDLEALNNPVRIPGDVRTIAITPPANPAYFHQAVRLFAALAADHPTTRFVVVHHRGNQRSFRSFLRDPRWSELDITGSVDGFAVYDRVDMHVGYRVHAHLFATSRGTVSYLLAEDSRGVGMLRAMPGLGRAAFDPEARSSLVSGPIMRMLPRIANAYRPGTSWIGAAIGPLLGLPRVDSEVVQTLRRDLAEGFPAHSAARTTIRATLPTMRRMVDTLP